MNTKKTEELQEAIDGWTAYAISVEDWNPGGARIARRVAEALRLEQQAAEVRALAQLKCDLSHTSIVAYLFARFLQKRA